MKRSSWFRYALVLVTALAFLSQNQLSAQEYANDFEEPVGSEWSKSAIGKTPEGPRSFLGPFGNETVSLTLHKEKAGITMVAFDLFLINSWDGNNTTYGPDHWKVDVTGGEVLMNTTFSNLDENKWSQAYPAAFGEGENRPGANSVEFDSLGYQGFGDSVYRLSFTIRHPAGPLVINFSASGLQGLKDESWGLDNVDVYLASLPVTKEWQGWQDLMEEFRALKGEKKYDLATLTAEKAIQFAQKLGGPNHSNVVSSLNSLADLYHRLENYEKAEATYRRSLAIMEKAYGPEHPRLGRCLDNLAEHFSDQDQLAKELPVKSRLLTIREKAFGLIHPETIKVRSEVALIYTQQEKLGQAEKLLKESFALLEKKFGQENPAVVNSMYDLAFFYFRTDLIETKEVIKVYQQLLAMNKEWKGPGHGDLVFILEKLVVLYTVNKQPEEVESCYQQMDQVWKIQKKKVTPKPSK